jgi:hypothetical protein
MKAHRGGRLLGRGGAGCCVGGQPGIGAVVSYDMMKATLLQFSSPPRPVSCTNVEVRSVPLNAGLRGTATQNVFDTEELSFVTTRPLRG